MTVDVNYLEADKEIEFREHGTPMEVRCVVCGNYSHSMDMLSVNDELWRKGLGVCMVCASSVLEKWFEDKEAER